MSTPDEQLEDLYPFLHGRRPDAPMLQAALLESVRQKAADSVETKRTFFREHAAAIVAAAEAMAGVYRNGGRWYCVGNGGSSCDAAHVAVEFQHPITAGRPALSAVNLSADVAMLTGVANDVGFRHVFVRQLLAQAKRGDGLIGLSTSGNSENLLEAFTCARQLGLVTLALCGGDGGRMGRSADIDHCLTVASDSIHRVQETHVVIYHILWDLVHTLLAEDRGSLATGDVVR
jgi:D-sedoheptulose 7-phosphate isomerase